MTILTNMLDLKNSTDDALPNYLTSLKFKQSHMLTDIRLGLGYTAVVISAITFYFDYKLGWEKTKDYTFWAVILYFILNSALTLWIWGVERGVIFNGRRDKARVSSMWNTFTNAAEYAYKFGRFQLHRM